MQLSFETATHLQVNPVASVRSLPKLGKRLEQGPEAAKSTAGGHGARRRQQAVGSVFTRRPRLSERDIERLSQQHSCQKQAQKSVLAFSHVTKQAYDPLHKGATLEVLTRTGSPVCTRARVHRGRPLHAQCEGREMPKSVQIVHDRTRVIVCPGCARVRSCTRWAGAGRATGALLLRPRLRVNRPKRISTEASPRDSMYVRTCAVSMHAYLCAYMHASMHECTYEYTYTYRQVRAAIPSLCRHARSPGALLHPGPPLLEPLTLLRICTAASVYIVRDDGVYYCIGYIYLLVLRSSSPSSVSCTHCHAYTTRALVSVSK